MYVAVPHFDKDHYHVHICASGVEYRTGKTMRLSKAEMQKMKKNIQKYQQQAHYKKSSSGSGQAHEAIALPRIKIKLSQTKRSEKSDDKRRR